MIRHSRMTHCLALLSLTASLLALAAPALAGSSYSLGVEGFYDRYREPDLDLRDTTDYGSVTGHYTYDFNRAFLALDGRASYGQDKYSSPSGNSSGADQYEFETRFRVGYTLVQGNSYWSPYIGIGLRYFMDQGKGSVTDLGAMGYDRHITQYYVPIGVTYSYLSDTGWTFAPNIEYDPLIHGTVDTHLQDVGLYNVTNTQTDGYGIRGEFMIGQKFDHYSWQAGPFVRYWDIRDSDLYVGPDGSGWIEPHNTRLQTGIAARLIW
jgi:hypothetical protein